VSLRGSLEEALSPLLSPASETRSRLTSPIRLSSPIRQPDLTETPFISSIVTCPAQVKSQITMELQDEFEREKIIFVQGLEKEKKEFEAEVDREKTLLLQRAEGLEKEKKELQLEVARLQEASRKAHSQRSLTIPPPYSPPINLKNVVDLGPAPVFRVLEGEQANKLLNMELMQWNDLVEEALNPDEVEPDSSEEVCEVGECVIC